MSISTSALVYLPAFPFWLYLASRLIIAVCNPRQAALWCVRGAHWLIGAGDAIHAAWLSWDRAKRTNADALAEATRLLTPQTEEV